MSPEEIKASAYKSIKEQLDSLFAKGGIPNLRAFQKIIRDLRKRIKLLDGGTAFFARSLEDVEKAQLQSARLSGQLQAYKERYDWIRAKLKETA
jgi:hypothetical protein